MSTGRPKDNENPPQVAPLFSPPRDEGDWGLYVHGTPGDIEDQYPQRSPQVVPLTESPSASFSSVGDSKSNNDIPIPPPILRIPSRGVFLSDEERKIQRKKDITLMIGFPEYTPDMNEYHKRVVKKIEILFQQGRITAEERDEAIADSEPSKCQKALQTTSDIATCQPIWWFARWFSQSKAKRQGGRKTRKIRKRRKKRKRRKSRRKRKTKKRKSLFKKKRTKRRKGGYGGKSTKRTKRRKR